MGSAAWTPQVGPQFDAIQASWCPEILFGGAAGGGKSDFLLGDYLQDVKRYGRHWRGIVFRRTNDELEELLERAHQIFPKTGAHYEVGKRTWRWPNGATLKMRFLEKAEHFRKYQGHQYAWIGWDELTNWPDGDGYKMLFSRLRSAQGPQGMRMRIRATANPGGPGHNWVKARFIDPHPGGYKPFPDPISGILRMFIPSRLSDNQILVKNDPAYINRLRASGSATLVRAWLAGDWNIVLGAYFTSFGPQHVIRPFQIPNSWGRARSFDWGYKSPFSVGWWAISNGQQPLGVRQYFPANALIRYREWYGASEPNVGLKMTNVAVAKEIVRRSGNESYLYSVADPSIFNGNGGETTGETYAKSGVIFRRADNDRVTGWQQLNERLVGQDDVPMIYFFDTCRDSIRTIPSLQHCKLNSEDVDTEGEDHAGDETRYMVKSRPWSPPPPSSSQPTGPDAVTYDQLMAAHRNEVARRRNR